MTFFRMSVRKTSGENNQWNEENTVKMILEEEAPATVTIAQSFRRTECGRTSICN